MGRSLNRENTHSFLQAGCSLVFVSSRKAAACEAAAAQLNALPGLQPGARAVAAPADTSTLAGIEALVAAVRARTEHVDILMANAGATWGAPFDAYPEPAFAKVMDLNVKAVFFCAQRFAPLLTRPGRATAEEPSRVIVTASVAGLGVGSLGANATFAYSASKAAAVHLARNLAVDLGPRHVRVNALCPGFFPTKMAAGLLDLTGGPARHARANPTGRLGRPDDVAGAVVYLASRAGAHVNGAALVVDGGAMWATGAMLEAGAAPEPKL